MSRRRVAILATILAASFPGVAQAATNGAVNGGKAPNVLPAPDVVAPTIFTPSSQTVPPPGFVLSARDAIRVADRTKAVREARTRHPTLTPTAYISPLGLRAGRFYHWDVIYRVGKTGYVEVELGSTGILYEIQTYPDVGWGLLRGYPGVLGGKLNAPYVWLPLCLLFLLPFLDLRRPFRLLHLDLAMLLAFGASHYFFNLGRPDISVPLVYPFLVYVVVRMLFAAYRPRRRSGELIPHFGTRVLTIGLLVLVALRIGFLILGSNSFDVTAAGVIGADRILHGLQLYVLNGTHGDTYGPLNYLLYIPGDLIWPYSYLGGFANAGKFSTGAFDLFTLLGLFLLGRRLRPGAAGKRLGVALAYAWAAYPYTALVIASNTNDALVPMFLVYALLFISSPVGRGAFTAFAGMTKFAPLILAPVLCVGRGPFRWRPVLIAGGTLVVICVGLVLAFWPAGGWHEFWGTTLGFQLHRTSPLALWVRYPGLGWLRALTEVFAVALAIVAAFLPRRRTVGQVAALCGAILAAAQIPTDYWIYFYLAWLAPFVTIALFEEHPHLGPAPAEDQGRVVRALLKDVKVSQPSPATTTRSSILTPNEPGR